MTLEEALEDALNSLREPPRTIEGIIGEFPSIGALAQWFAGSPKRSGNAYRAARRRFERYAAKAPKERRRPSQRFVDELRDRLRRRRRRFQKQGGRVRMHVLIHISHEHPRDRMLKALFPPEVLNELLDLFEGKGIDEAADRFTDAMAEYGLGGGIPVWDDIFSLTITPGPA